MDSSMEKQNDEGEDNNLSLSRNRSQATKKDKLNTATRPSNQIIISMTTQHKSNYIHLLSNRLKSST